MSLQTVSEEELRHRLSGKLSPEAIAALLNEYAEAEGATHPDMEEINRLVRPQRRPAQQNFLGEQRLTVRFELDSDRLDVLSAYFNNPDLPANALVKRAVDEFIALIS